MAVIKSIIFVLVLYSISACGSVQQADEDKVIVHLKNYDDSTGNCDSTYSNNCAQIQIEFPQIEYSQNHLVEKKINNSIKNYVLQPVFGENQPATAEKLIENFLKEYETFKDDFPEAFQHWSLERIGEVRYNSSYVFSVEFSEYSYLGGAHPNTYVTFTNFDIKSGEKIRMDDLFKQNFNNELNRIAELKFRKLKELNETEDLGQAGFWFDDNRFYLNDNFIITNSSLIFYYNNYEITAYAFGPTELEIPYSRIKHLVKPDGLLAPLIDEK
ncbi:MAG: DUF3298 and DUF4163 domain-containing protein [Ignavibacteria bacterium]|nr:DUF3298 and DUF4163 domain-containing protein [Ignavibacteria bacterium]MBT8382454.1 DUF3298 and DUF4163 domain-containing protein [Ignavibacteria bacterium]MBT8392831.1 DUF3298 and DUF4163 domain-containing protein [Ignavibacteria bacterium]NNJ52130.1 DUF3298 and DUF4163 domain-containing protein [Ignavibacteriaceae bacterium]NNL20216.1 DUF3298 and DUF4163 domain-containing protein [Ignavibacteriaceae bacterium]